MSGAFSHSRLTLLDDCPRRYPRRCAEKIRGEIAGELPLAGGGPCLLHAAKEAHAWIRRRESTRS